MAQSCVFSPRKLVRHFLSCFDIMQQKHFIILAVLIMSAMHVKGALV